ncbi:hypothetical protein LUZ62_079865 [Rhynchospora pubera]|uniref:Uncharacterized protein n=1 Tax=Rhynchospora pubera TaxID=906938 RepID=A0AAV8BQK6_9POAL|nr:hypothetical protein LUZ62_079865 [Rhynchospora pubera]
MASGSNKYEVKIRSVDTVIPVVLVQGHRLPQSNFDLLVPPGYSGLYFCFHKPTPRTCQDASVGFTTFPTMVAALKAALSKVLVIYYPLAGEFVTNSVGEAEILCNSRGVDLIEAYADVELRELNLYNPSVSVEAKLLPEKINGILSIQVTELRCGAMVVGCAFDHRATDAYSFFMFMSAWADISRNMPITQIPSYCRSLLSPRIISPSNSSDPIFDQIFTPLSFLPSVNPKTSLEYLVNHIYYISAADIARLQELSGHSHSKLVCFTAYCWKILARSACRVADEVEKWLSPATTEDHFLGLLDWVEAHRTKPILSTIFAADNKEEDKSVSCMVSSGRWFAEIDFGWGNAAFWSSHFPRRQKGGFLMPIPQPTTGDWIVYAQVAPSIVAAMEQEPTIFCPLRNLAVYESNSSRARL